jgi:hypothetical protein
MHLPRRPARTGDGKDVAVVTAAVTAFRTAVLEPGGSYDGERS